MLSWTGNHGNITVNQTLHFLHRSNLDDIMFCTFDDTELKNVTTKFTVTNNFCKVIEIIPSRTERMSIRLGGNDSFNVIVNDPVHMKDLLFSQMAGNKILHDNKDGKNEIKYLINLKVTEDKTGGDSCIEYLNSHFQSFSQCIEDEIVQKTRSVFGFGLPFFASAEKTLKPIQRLQKHEKTVKWLRNIALDSHGGIIYKSETCLPSCTSTSATAKEQLYVTSKERWVFLFFNNRVEVQTTVLAYGVDSLLVEVGSSLGLWLGLSVVGVFDLISTFSEILVKRVQTIRRELLIRKSQICSGKESNLEQIPSV